MFLFGCFWLFFFGFKLLYIVFNIFNVSIRCDHYCWLVPRHPLTWFQQSLMVSWLSESKNHFRLMLQQPPSPPSRNQQFFKEPWFLSVGYDMQVTIQVLGVSTVTRAELGNVYFLKEQRKGWVDTYFCTKFSITEFSPVFERFLS